MGYDLHIIRSEVRSDSEPPRITMEEWRALLEADPALDLRDKIRAMLPGGEALSLQFEGLAVSSGHPQRRRSLSSSTTAM
jgi:hypothetical protein